MIADEIARAFDCKCAKSAEMESCMLEWTAAFENSGKWLTERVKSLRLPAAIVKETKRLVLTEFVLESEQDKTAYDNIRRIICDGIGFAFVTGGALLKPYFNSSTATIDIVSQDRFIPVVCSDSHVSSVICTETVLQKEKFYTRAEFHRFDERKKQHTIIQKCFVSAYKNTIGKECSLKLVPEWSDLLPSKTYENVEQPLFSIFRMPDENSVDRDSPLGISVFADAMDLFQDADEQWERIRWELQSSERAIDASEDYFRYDPISHKPILPKGRERMFRALERTGNGESVFNTFSPEIRDASQFNALNEILRQIENRCGLSYGTLSKVESVEKTATEVIASKQRSYTHISNIQCALKLAIEKMMYGVQYYNRYYNQEPEQAYTLAFGDGVLEDVDTEFQRRLLLVQSGYLKPEKLLSWYFGCKEKEAAEMMPAPQQQFQNPFGNGSVV